MTAVWKNTHLPEIKTASDFVAFMEEVWSEHTEPSPSGGNILYMHPLYNDFHDAIIVAKLLSLPKTGTTKLSGDWAGTFLFPDNSRVTIARSGDAVAECKTRFTRRSAE